MMSGGSFNYVSLDEIADILHSSSKLDDLKALLNAMDEYSSGDVPGLFVATAHSRLVLERIQQIKKEMEELEHGVNTTRLRFVWRAIEWERSNDVGVTDIASAVQQYLDRKEQYL